VRTAFINATRQALLATTASIALLAGAAQAQTLKIGLIGPLTGPGAPWGIAAVEAARLLAEEANAKGGLQVGTKKYKVEPVSYDDKYSSAESVAAYNRLVNQDGVKFMVIMTGAATMALKQNVEDDKVLALTSSYAKALDKNTKYMYRLYSDPDQYVGSFAEWLKNNVKGRKVVTLNPNDETGWHVAEAAEKALKANGFEVHKELFERSQKDFQPTLTKIMALKPDLIDLGSTSPATAGLVVRQARELGYDKLISKMGGPGPRDIVASAGTKAAEGTINMLYADPANPGYRRLADAYKKARGQEANEIMIPYYDGMNVMLQAIQQAGTVDDTAKVAAAFAKVLPMKSVQGDDLRLGGMANYGSNTEFLSVNYIGVIREGQPVVVGKTK